MSFRKYKSLREAILHLQKEGFTSEFMLTGGKMRASNTGKEYDFNQMEIVCFQRFRDVPNLGSNMTVIFAVRCHDGVQGTIIHSDKTSRDMKLIEFMDKVKIEKLESMPNNG